MFYPEDLAAEAEEGTMEVSGTVSYYRPRQRFPYNMATISTLRTTLPVCIVGRVIEDVEKLEMIGLQHLD